MRRRALEATDCNVHNHRGGGNLCETISFRTYIFGTELNIPKAKWLLYEQAEALIPAHELMHNPASGNCFFYALAQAMYD